MLKFIKFLQILIRYIKIHKHTNIQQTHKHTNTYKHKHTNTYKHKHTNRKREKEKKRKREREKEKEKEKEKKKIISFLKKKKEVVSECTLCDICFVGKCPYVPPHPFQIDFPHLMLRYKILQFQKNSNSSLIEMMPNLKHILNSNSLLQQQQNPQPQPQQPQTQPQTQPQPQQPQPQPQQPQKPQQKLFPNESSKIFPSYSMFERFGRNKIDNLLVKTDFVGKFASYVSTTVNWINNNKYFRTFFMQPFLHIHPKAGQSNFNYYSLFSLLFCFLHIHFNYYSLLFIISIYYSLFLFLFLLFALILFYSLNSIFFFFMFLRLMKN